MTSTNYNNLVWPKILHWPTSPHKPRGNRAVNPEHFLFKPIVITEKLDGSNTMIHNGEIFNRDTSTPARAAFNAMVLKHHAWKTTEEYKDYFIFGENTYAIHSIRYAQQDAADTFRVFAILAPGRRLLSWKHTVELAAELAIPTVPILHEGIFTNKDELSTYLSRLHSEPSALGGEREGMVIRDATEIYEFNQQVDTTIAKSVRKNHVKPNAKHWSLTWERADIKY